MLDLATELGIGYIDVARSTGLPSGSWPTGSRDTPRLEMTIGSKWGYRYVGEWQVEPQCTGEGPLAGRLAQWRESRQLLGTRLRLYQIHSATPDTGVLSDLEVLAELVGMGEEEGW